MIDGDQKQVKKKKKRESRFGLQELIQRRAHRHSPPAHIELVVSTSRGES